MNYSQLLQLYFERSSSLQWYWTLYVVIVGGLLAFSSIRKQPDRGTAVLVMVLFCFFAYKNLGAIHDVTLQRMAVLKLMEERQLPVNEQSNTSQVAAVMEPTLQVPDYEGVRNFHVASDVLTVLALWTMERRRLRWKAATEQPA
jgi:hypothetical protein